MTSHRTSSRNPRAMTLMEIMMVVAVISILVAIGFGAYQGFNKSTSMSTAQGQISSALGIARAQAMANQEITGILFYNPSSPVDFNTGKPLVNNNKSGRQICVALVRATEVRGYLNMKSVVPSVSPDPEVVLDLVDMDPFYLPDNISVQTVISTTPDYNINLYFDKATKKDKAVSRIQESYLGYNRLPLDNKKYLSSPIGGVILFDQTGQLVQVRYAFRMKYSNLKDPTQYEPSLFFSTLFSGINPQEAQFDDVSAFVKQVTFSSDPDKGKCPYSSPGMVLFDRTKFMQPGDIKNTEYSDDDYVFDDSPGDSFNKSKIIEECNNLVIDTITTKAGEKKEVIRLMSKEIWIDRNATPFMVSQYSGALQKVK